MIRKGTHDDVASIIVLGAKLHLETSYRHVTFAPEKAEKLVHLLVDYGFFMVAEVDGLVVGGMMGDCVDAWYTDDLTGIEFSLYLDPEHRSGLIAAKLVSSFVKWCKMMGAKQIRPGVGTGHEGVGRLYEALGFEKVGSFYCMDIEK